jgi:hypothetical protein
VRILGGVLAAVAAVAVFIWALRRKHAARVPSGLRPRDGSDVVGFELIRLTPSDGETHAWLARYPTQPSAVEFEIRMRVAEPAGSSPFAQGSVLFRRVAGTSGAGFLRDLARALSLPGVPPPPGPPFEELRCEVSFMGSRLTRGDGADVIAGSFTAQPPGDWIVGKVFFAGGDGEIFLAVNPAAGRGEFLAKDPDLSAAVVGEFGRLFA